MSISVGLLEVGSLSRGIQIADGCLKTADITLTIRTTCPGKMFLILSGEISAVKSAVEQAQETSAQSITGSILLGNIHPDVLPALSGVSDLPPEERAAMGIIETFSVIAALHAADTAAKAAQIRIIDIRPAYGLGGKGLVIFTGSVGDVQTALEHVIALLKEEGDLLDAVAIPAPHAHLWEQLA